MKKSEIVLLTFALLALALRFFAIDGVAFLMAIALSSLAIYTFI